MNLIANLLFYVAIGGFVVGVSLNIGYLLSLPASVPRRVRWPVFAWLIMLLGLGQWFGRASTVAGVTSVDTSATVQIASIGVAGVILLFVAGKSYRSQNFRSPFFLLFIFGLLGVLTSPISDVPALSAFKAASVVVAVLLAVMAIKPLQDEKLPGLVFNVVYIYFVLIAFLAVLGGVVAPEITHRPNNGVFGFMLEGWPSLNSNSLSYVAAVVFVISLRRIFIKQLFRRRILYLSACTVGLVTLLMAQGRTSIISSTLAILFMSYFIHEMRSMRYVLISGVVALIGMIVIFGSVGDWTSTVEQYMQRGVTDEQIGTLSGRTEAWDLSWRLFLDSPITGYGFYAAGKTLVAPHNAYFTILLNGGLLGFIPWVLAVLGGMWMISRHIMEYQWKHLSSENNYYKEIVAVMIVQFVRTITGQDLTIHSYSMLVFLGAIIYVVVRENMPRIDDVEIDETVIKDKSALNSRYESVSLRKTK